MENKQPAILVLFYSLYGHTFGLANAAVEGVKVAGGLPRLRAVPEIAAVDDFSDTMKTGKFLMKDVKEASPKEDLKDIDGMVLAAPARFGHMAVPMRNFWEQTNEAWMQGFLIGKPVTVMTSTASQHDGQETALIGEVISMLHHGMIIVGLPHSHQEQMTLDEISGGSPYGASTITGGAGERMPSDNELKLAKKQAKYLTEVAGKMMG